MRHGHLGLPSMIGKGSWFGGPHDPEDSGHTASGGTTAEPGIAVYNHKTLGGYWRVTAPNGKIAVLKQTDIGPAPWTGRKVDVTYSALGHLGYQEHSFPTDAQFKAEYLGRSPVASIASKGTQSAPNAIRASTSTPTTTLDTKGLEAAQQKSRGLQAAAGLFGGSKPGDVALREALMSAGTKPILTSVGQGHELINHPGQTVVAPGGLGHYDILPKGAPVLGYNRKDQGRDLQLKPGQTLVAPGDYQVLSNGSDPSGFGPSYPILHITSGRYAGHDVYYGHTDSLVKPGQRGKAGDTVARTSTTGHNAPPGWLEFGYAPHGTPGPFGQPAPF